MVATAGVALVHVPPPTVELNVVLPAIHASVVPDKVPALGAAVMVTVLVSVASAHPPVPVTVYVITDVPALTPVITPVPPTIVATPGLALVQVPPPTVEVNVVVNPTQAVVVPFNVPALGAVLIVTVLVSVASAHPPVPVTV
jgi:hypothetical protein